MTKYETALELLKKASLQGSRLGLERVTELVSLLGDPQNSYKIIHVAGTNGKGSFSAMLSSVLSAQGYKVGTFSSPYMLTYNDCVRINGMIVSEETFGDAVIRAAEVSEQMTEPPTEFELLTGAVFMLLKEQGCEYAVIECGMGGDGDSTNVIKEPLLSVITNVELDHQAFLGNTHAEIASHKAGIIKQGIPVFFGGDNAEALEVIKGRAECNGSKLYRPEPSKIRFIDTDKILSKGITFNYGSAEVSVPLRGSYQFKNIINVISCIDILRELSVKITDLSVCVGLASVSWEGRFELLSADPTVIFDGAHNPDGMRSLCDSIKLCFPNTRPVILTGVLADKDYKLYSDMLYPLIDSAFTITPDNPRALGADKLAECFNENGIRAKAFTSIRDGLNAAYEYCKQKDLPLLIIGSLYLYKDIRPLVPKRLIPAE